MSTESETYTDIEEFSVITAKEFANDELTGQYLQFITKVLWQFTDDADGLLSEQVQIELEELSEKASKLVVSGLSKKLADRLKKARAEVGEKETKDAPVGKDAAVDVSGKDAAVDFAGEDVAVDEVAAVDVSGKEAAVEDVVVVDVTGKDAAVDVAGEDAAVDKDAAVDISGKDAAVELAGEDAAVDKNAAVDISGKDAAGDVSGEDAAVDGVVVVDVTAVDVAAVDVAAGKDVAMDVAGKDAAVDVTGKDAQSQSRSTERLLESRIRMDRKVKRSKEKAIDYANRIEKKNTNLEMGMKKLKKVVPRLRVPKVPKVQKVVPKTMEVVGKLMFNAYMKGKN